MSRELFTIGHSLLTLDHFISLLKRADIGVIADVRSSPHSGRAPWFSQQELKVALKQHSIKYVFLGRELGGRPSSERLFTNGVADYGAMSRTSEFAEGIGRIVHGVEAHRIALMCSERDPLECHRFLLVSKHLSSLGMQIVHLKSDGGRETQAEAEMRLMKEERLGDDLFAARASQLANAYQKRSASAAYSVARSQRSKPT